LLFQCRLAYAGATALAITACAALCAQVLPAPLMLPLATIIANCYCCHLPFDCCFSLFILLLMAVILSMLQPLLAFAVVVLLHCRLMPWQFPLTGVITIVIAAG